MLINGVGGFSSEVASALLDCTISFQIDGTSTVTLVIEDPQRKLLRSKLTQQKSVVTIDGISFVLNEVQKTGPQMQLTFYHTVASKMMDAIQSVVEPPGAMTRTAFVTMLARMASNGWIDVVLPAGESPMVAQTQLTSGFVETPTQIGQAGIQAQVSVVHNPIVTIIVQVASQNGLEPRLAVAIAQEESGLNPRAVGAGSYGLFQLQVGGELTTAGLTPAEAFDPTKNCEVAIPYIAQQARLHPNWTPGEIAAAAQRPANPSAYAAAVNSIYNSLSANLNTVNPSDKSAYVTAGTQAQPQSFWDSSGQVLDSIGWRRFPRSRKELIVVNDTWLYGQAAIYHPTEVASGIDAIDFDWSIRQPLASLTITCRAEAWAWPVGAVIQLGSDMGAAEGKWLVTNIARSLLSASATITCSIPQPTLTETQAANTVGTNPVADIASVLLGGSAAPYINSIQQQLNSGALGTPGRGAGIVGVGGRRGGGGFIGNGSVQDMVSWALSKDGGPYVWGGTGPVGFDCSGFVQAAIEHEGIRNVPRVVLTQYAWYKQNRTIININDAINTRGAILCAIAGAPGASASINANNQYPDEHTAISLGNGTTIEAMGSAYGITKGTADPNRFNIGALVPGLGYSR